MRMATAIVVMALEKSRMLSCMSKRRAAQVIVARRAAAKPSQVPTRAGRAISG